MATTEAATISEEVHPDYTVGINELTKVRDCLEGSPEIKRKGYRYLPHPSQIDTESNEQKLRYKEYIAGAEFEPYPEQTRRTLLGKMRIGNTTVELPDRISYLEQNVDGDGMSLKGAVEFAASNVLSMKWHVLVADYQGLSDVDLNAISIADLEAQNPRSSIKQYTRENVVNWHFDRINGAMQLRFIMLLERGTEFNQDSFMHQNVESFLVLALDENGDYYQQKIVYGTDGKQEGERSYVTVNGSPLKWLPVSIVADEEMSHGIFSRGMGFLHPICDATLHRYRVSAVYKETQRSLVPTKFTKGWKTIDKDIFKEINGRDYQVTGGYGVNNYPNSVEVGVLSAEANMDDFHWYFTESDKRIRMLGGTSDKAGAMTATEAEIAAADQNALLETVADNSENSWKRAISYCAMFEGVWQPEAVESSLDQITLDLPRDFASPRLTTDEVRTLIELKMNGDISQPELHRQLENGGWLISDVDSMMQEMENQGPLIGNNDGL
ncbi:MAG: hypothetical protein CL578_22430 [Alteromonadaceae bacterium]|jgi:hypothetical protein|uniref:hypothetical protein n=1 Tax=unclassified Methylophaga TaxID=2629249 RepID=UPI000C533DE7|nr:MULTISPECIES: hypothetical protein [unclassified Methylophaga]MAP27781.1 hypothetical protein [Methylophaga sp.]MBN27785.1 hypothetical protein [Alteromonadaceae bacterium]HAD31533.1 hypothetical protein [Methylophaga sp.]HBX59829.1 hypothetical protein [Methylophaga sp.]|tara:strand:- start:25890 stop:27377 length:1488 start_codon:yes stop_codon:yes gene_type:complete